MKKSSLLLSFVLLLLIFQFPAQAQNPYQNLNRAQLAQSLQIPIKVAYGTVDQMDVSDWKDLRDEYQPLVDAYFSAANLKFEKYLEAVAAYRDAQKQANPQAAYDRWVAYHETVSQRAASITEELGGVTPSGRSSRNSDNGLDDLLGESMDDVRSLMNNLGGIVEDEDAEEINQLLGQIKQMASKDIKAWNMGSLLEFLENNPNLLEEGFDNDADNVYDWFDSFYTHSVEEQTEENFQLGGPLPYQDMKGILYQSAGAGHSFFLRSAKDKQRGAAMVYDFRLTAKTELLEQYRMLHKIVNGEKTPELKKLYDEWIAQKQKVQKLYNLPKAEREFSQLSQEENKLAQMERELIKGIPTAGQPLPKKQWQDIQQKLNENEAAIEIIRFPNHESNPDNKIFYAALIIKRGEGSPIPVIIGGDELEAKYFPKYNLEKGEERMDPIYYKTFWAPIQEQLGGIEKVYLSTDGIYHSINFNILPWPEGDDFLIDHLHILLTNSTGDLLGDPAPNSKKDAVLMGGVDFAATNEEPVSHPINSAQIKISEEISTNWAPLPNSEQEVLAIGTILEEAQYNVAYYTGAKANESIIKQTSPSILHLATHGFFLDSKYREMETQMLEPYQASGSTRLFKMSRSIVDNYYGVSPEEIDPMLRSGLVLAGGKHWPKAFEQEKEDGILLAYEVSTLNLSNTELAVLSGCDTGTGETVGGEGIHGLQQAFKVAGVESLIMSLWPVPDQVAEEFLYYFYNNWLKEGMLKSEAFRSAQQLIREDWELPLHWGAFIYMEL